MKPRKFVTLELIDLASLSLVESPYSVPVYRERPDFPGECTKESRTIRCTEGLRQCGVLQTNYISITRIHWYQFWSIFNHITRGGQMDPPGGQKDPLLYFQYIPSIFSPHLIQWHYIPILGCTLSFPTSFLSADTFY